jgi:hypothetical protein
LTGCAGVSAGSNQSRGTGQTGILSLSQGGLDFGSVAAGGTKILTVTATNSGAASLTINSASASTKYFAVTAPSLPLKLSAGQSATISIQFSPNAAAAFNASITISSDASNPLLAIAVSGIGTSTGGPGQLTVNPTALAFGSVVMGNSKTLSGIVTATGASVTITGAPTTNDSAFVVTGLAQGTTIAAGQSASFTVAFTPAATGAANATLTFISNAQSSTTTATLSGTGTAASSHSVNLSWDSSSSANVAGYNIYRAAYTTSCGSYAKLNSLLNTGTLYTDSSVSNGASYCYSSTAVNTSDEESTYSNIVSNVQIPAQ